MAQQFRFDIGDIITLAGTGETREVIGRSEYSEGPPCYSVRIETETEGQATAVWREADLAPDGD